MMRFQIISVGRLDAPYLREGVETYLRRLRPYTQVTWQQVPDEAVPARPRPADVERIQAVEAERIQGVLDRLPGHVYTVALTRRGWAMTSPQLAQHLDQVAVDGFSTTAWLIGGTVGLAPQLVERAHLRLSMSTLTFPHQMMPLLLLEQLFRACRIQRGEPYHYSAEV